MTEISNQMDEAFVRRCRPRHFDDVCVITLDDGSITEELSWFSAGVDSRARVGIRGFVFELGQFNRHQSFERGLGHLIRFITLVCQRDGLVNWLHGERFVNGWRQRKILGMPPENFETEGEAVAALHTALQAARLRADLPHRLTTCGLSITQIANVAGLFENDVRRIAAGQQEASDAVVISISSALDALITKRVPEEQDGA